MFQYKPKGNNLYSYVICDFKGMNMIKAKKETNKKKYEVGRQRIDVFSEIEGVKYCRKFSDTFSNEDKNILDDLLFNFGSGLNKKQEKYLIENSNSQIVIKTKNVLPKKKTTLRLEEAFLFTLLVTENTDSFAHAIREAITKYIVDNNFIKTLERVNNVLETHEISSVDEFFTFYK